MTDRGSQFCLLTDAVSNPSGSVPFLVDGSISSDVIQATILLSTKWIAPGKGLCILQGPPLSPRKGTCFVPGAICTGATTRGSHRLNLADGSKHAYFRIGPSKGRARWVPFGQDLARELKAWLDQAAVRALS